MDFLLNMVHSGLSTIIPFVILLGLLIFVHELGHFLVAKYYGVRVEVFSLGFGKKLFKVAHGTTDYCISLIPFGGYVKMYGDEPTAEVPEHEKGVAFNHKPVGQRIAIVLAGPLMNLIFAAFLFTVISMIGEAFVKPVVGDVPPETSAFQAGFRPGDTISEVNGEKIETWESLKSFVEKSAGEVLTFKVLRNGETSTIQATPKEAPNKNIISSETRVGDIEGLSFLSKASIIGISPTTEPAGRAGLKTGDIIRSINGVELTQWKQLEAAIAKVDPSDQLMIEAERGLDNAEERIKFEVPVPANWPKDALGRLTALGIDSAELFVEVVVEDSPAAAAGIIKGDRILSVNGKALSSWEDLVDAVSSFKEDDPPLSVQVRRSNEVLNLSIAPKKMTQVMPSGQEEEAFALGLKRTIAYAPPETVVISTSNIGKAFLIGLKQTAHWTEITVLSFVRIIQARVSPKSIGGPIMIGQLARDTFKIGLSPFFKIMAIISLNLFVLNLLPVPVLDGGHLVFYIIEAVRGAPLSLRKMEVAQQVGLALLLGLMVFALFNDATRILNNW